VPAAARSLASNGIAGDTGHNFLLEEFLSRERSESRPWLRRLTASENLLLSISGNI
jgi:hypothetical protein